MALSDFDRAVLVERTLPGLRGVRMEQHFLVHDQATADELAAFFRGRRGLPKIHFRIAPLAEPIAWGRH